MISYEINPEVSNESLNALYEDAWPHHSVGYDFEPILSHSLGYVCATEDGKLVGFVYVAWDGDKHAFLLEPTVRSDCRRRGIGTELVRRAAEYARSKGIDWLHVDFEPHLIRFYAKCGFKETEAGLLDMRVRE